MRPVAGRLTLGKSSTSTVWRVLLAALSVGFRPCSAIEEAPCVQVHADLQASCAGAATVLPLGLLCGSDCLAAAWEDERLSGNATLVEADLPTAADCQEACRNHSSCTHFSYDTARGVFQHACWLKAGGECTDLLYTTRPGYISGPSICPGGWDGPVALKEDSGGPECLYQDADYGNEAAGSCGYADVLDLHASWACLTAATAGHFWPPDSLAEERVYDTPAECRWACEATPGCEYFTYIATGSVCNRSCWLKAPLPCEEGFGTAVGRVSGSRSCANLTTSMASLAEAATTTTTTEEPQPTRTTSTTTRRTVPLTTTLTAASTSTISTSTSTPAPTSTSTPGVTTLPRTTSRITTGPTTRTTTATSSTTTQLMFCADFPQVLAAPQQTQCTRLPSGGVCHVSCSEGHTMQGTVQCEAGSWIVTGACVPRGASTVSVKVVLLSLSVHLGSVASSSPSDNAEQTASAAAWAEANLGVLASAAAVALGQPEGRLRLQVSTATQSLRRLASSGTPSTAPLAGTFSLLVAVLLESNGSDPNINNTTISNLSDVAQTYQRRIEDGYGVALVNGLGQASLNVSVQVVGTPQVVQDFAVSALEWTIGPWQSCSAGGCEQPWGEQRREVHCTAGYSEACLSDGKAKPTEVQRCFTQAKCQDVTCPFGPRSLACSTQRVLLVVALLVLALPCAILGLRAFRRQRLRQVPTREMSHQQSEASIVTNTLPSILAGRRAASAPVTGPGKDVISEELLPGGIRAVRRNVRSMDDQGCPDAAGTLGDSGIRMRTTRSDDMIGGKAKIVYEYDMQQALEWLSQQRREAPEGDPGQLRTLANSQTSSLDSGPEDTADEETNQREGFSLHGWTLQEENLDEGSGPHLVPWRVVRFAPRAAYEDQQRVEYYSRRHSAWQTGVLHLKRRRSTPTRAPEVLYNVELLPNKQMRFGVALDTLRLPLQDGELVEVYRRKRSSVVWLPGRIQGPQASLASVMGYHVDLQGEGLCQSLPSYRVRRRFPVGARVEVFRGPETGWVPAVVQAEPESMSLGHPAASADIKGVPGAALPGLPRISASSRSLRSGGRATPRATQVADVVKVGETASSQTRCTGAQGCCCIGPHDCACRGTAAGGRLATLRRLLMRRNQPQPPKPKDSELEAVSVQEERRTPHAETARSTFPSKGKFPQPQYLHLEIHCARGFAGSRRRLQGAYCTCSVEPERPGGSFRTSRCSPPTGSGLTWHHEGEIPDYVSGESLVFTVMSKEHKVMGKATLDSSSFYPEGYEGELRLHSASGRDTGALLWIEVLPAEPDLWTEVLVQEEEEERVADESQGCVTIHWVPLYLLRARDPPSPSPSPDSTSLRELLPAEQGLCTL